MRPGSLLLLVKKFILELINQASIYFYLEMTPAQLILRKLVTLHDLTVCLDRRNSSGKIEFYEVFNYELKSLFGFY